MRRTAGRPRSVALRTVGVAAALSAAVVGLGACSGGPQPVPSTDQTLSELAQAEGEVNTIDVQFLQLMVAHHEQGLEMVGLAVDRAHDDDVRDLAAAVEATQSDEADMMRDWLVAWGESVETDEVPGSHGHHDALPAVGPREIEELRQSEGPAFDTSFLNLFLAHQHNAVEMAQAQQERGVNPEVTDLAARIVESRAGQVQQMLGMLGP